MSGYQLMRRALAGLAAAVMAIGLAGCGSKTQQKVTIPYCPSGYDICLEGMGINATSNGTVTGYVRVKTIDTPKAFEAFARLYTRIRGVWYEQDTKTWKKNKLPARGHTATLVPDLHTYCNTGPWMMSVHTLIISSTGVHQSLWTFYPGVKRATGTQIHTALLSTKDLPQSSWPWLTIKHCT